MLQRSARVEWIGAFGRHRLQPTCGLIVCISYQECCQDLKQAVHVDRVTTDYPPARDMAQVCLQDVICELMQDSFNVIRSLLFSARVSLDALNLSAQEGLTASHKKRSAASNLDREKTWSTLLNTQEKQEKCEPGEDCKDGFGVLQLDRQANRGLHAPKRASSPLLPTTVFAEGILPSGSCTA